MTRQLRDFAYRPVDSTPRGPRRTVIASPHLDDAALSTWHAIGESVAPVLVITVFAGTPAGEVISPVDRRGGASDSASWVQRRRAEDLAALSRAGVQVRHFDLLDAQYRALESGRLRSLVAAEPARFVELAAQEPVLEFPVEAIVERLAPELDSACLLYLPAGIGGHPDHRSVSRTGLLLASRVAEIRYYADSPYFLVDGCPSWFGNHDQLSWRSDERIVRAIAATGVPMRQLRLTTVSLSPMQDQAKVAALSCYRTELHHLRPRLAMADPSLRLTKFEVYWATKS